MRARKIDDSRLITLKNEGRLQKDIAKILGVSEPAITKRLKRLFPERYEPPRSLEVLTDKEQRFAIGKASGRTATEAALNAFECSSRQSAKAIGCQLMGKPEVQEAITDLMDQVGLTKRYRIAKLKRHVDNKVDPHVSLKALDQSFRLDGSYAPTGSEGPTVSYTKVDINLYSSDLNRRNKED
jgi:hypothetical protein